jgi:hypothetical protein
MKINTYIKIILLLGSFLCAQPVSAWPKFGEGQKQQAPAKTEKSNPGVLSGGLSSMIGIGFNNAGRIEFAPFAFISLCIIGVNWFINYHHIESDENDTRNKYVRALFNKYGLIRTVTMIFFARGLLNGSFAKPFTVSGTTMGIGIGGLYIASYLYDHIMSVLGKHFRGISTDLQHIATAQATAAKQKIIEGLNFIRSFSI